MTTVNPISGDPFKPDEKLRPKPEQLKSFLESASREGGKELYGDDLVPYRLLLESADAFDSGVVREGETGGSSQTNGPCSSPVLSIC